MQHFFRTSIVILVFLLLIGTGLAAAQTAQFTINGGPPITIPLKPNTSGGWSGSGLSPLPDNLVVSFSSETDPFLRSSSLSVTVQGQSGAQSGEVTAVGVLFSTPVSLPAGPTNVTSQASGANFGPVDVSATGEVSANVGATYQNMGVDIDTSVSVGGVTVGPKAGPNSPPFNFMRVTGSFNIVGRTVLTTGVEFTIQPGGLGSPAPTAKGSSTNGAGRFTSLLTGPVQFSLNSRQHKDGTAQGVLSYREAERDFEVQVAIKCLNVAGERAVLTGTIVS
ncbi:MAG: hypothetical protein ACREQV_11065, partial [Candidatus Binatia bacterium]